MTAHGAVTIVYEDDGNRVSETVGSTTTKYLVDTAHPGLSCSAAHAEGLLFSRVKAH